jgi:hypothetical protein
VVQRLLKPTPLNSVGHVTPWQRFRLVGEVLVTYVPLLRLLRRNDAQAMVEGARCTRARIVVPASEHHETAVRLGHVTNAVLSRLPSDKRCLIRSLVVVRLLANRSIDADLIIGVRNDEGFQAHAWVEHAGRPVLPREGFHRLASL